MKIFIIILLSIISFQFVIAQTGNQTLKTEALDHMNKGLYGEAIDLLNKYISAKPQEANGYNLRGLCYEKRGEYENAVYDYRTAKRIEPKNSEINNNLRRTENAWFTILYNKIEGYKREIVINPDNPKNYLKIGKSFKNLGDWEKAEIWYDEYLKREEPSADEVIRYTEILARNNHISKGIPILKKFVEKYPDDHRLLSRYGYFNLWLGHKKTALNSFKKSLAIKPYFKEALNGISLVSGKGYIYFFNDTVSYKSAYVPVKKTVYLIDEYFKSLKRNSENNNVRVKLIRELLKHNRVEEALQQLNILSEDSSYADLYQKLLPIAEAKKDSITKNNIEKYSAIVEKDPKNKEAVLKLANYYANLKDYDNALNVFDKYFETLPSEDISDVRFRYAQYSAWNYEFEKAIQQLEILLYNAPDNLDYQLLRAQIAVWSDLDLDLAEKYLKNILSKEPKNLNALIATASLKVKQDDLVSAKNYLDRAMQIDPKSKEAYAVQIYYDAAVSRAEGMKIYQILFDARDLAVEKKCDEALKKYEEYFSRITAPTRLERTEYANTAVCAKKYDLALRTLTELLNEEYDFDLAVLKGNVYLWSGDSLNALSQFKKLSEENPDNYNVNLGLAASYEKLKNYDIAETIYEKMLSQTDDSSKAAIINQRLGWLPKISFPIYAAVSPSVYYYNDNQNFDLLNLGVRFELGLTKFLTIGGAYQNHFLKSDSSRRLNSIKGQIFLRFTPYFSANGSFGVVTTPGEDNKNIYDASIIYKDSAFSVNAYYEHTDARLLLYSPFLINTILDVNFYRLSFNYLFESKFILSGYFSHVSVSDNNKGNNLQARIGYKLIKSLAAGYEFYYLNFNNTVKSYYSPKNFSSHSIWASFDAAKNKNLELNFGGQIGYIADINFTLSEIHAELNYNIFQNLILYSKLSFGNNFKFSSSYNYFSASGSIYWSF